jgi:hypothetical protein
MLGKYSYIFTAKFDRITLFAKRCCYKDVGQELLFGNHGHCYTDSTTNSTAVIFALIATTTKSDFQNT